MTKQSAALGPTLETERLILRPPAAEDFDGFCAFLADGEATRFLSGVQPPSVVWRTMRVGAGSWALDGFHFFSVIEKNTNAWIGRVGPIHPHDWPGPEVGWGLLPACWGKGYAREAAAAAMDFAFDELGWGRVIHVIAPENSRSIAVARALGSHNSGPGRLPEPFAHLPADIWTQSREEWRARSGRTAIMA